MAGLVRLALLLFGVAVSVATACYAPPSALGQASAQEPSGLAAVETKLTARDGAAFDFFGSSVAISGDTVVVGADAQGPNAGAVYIFARDGASWSQQAKLTASDAAPVDRFGASVAISGDTVVVGAGGDDDAGQNSGSAYIFARSGARWTQQAKLTASDSSRADEFGLSVAISGDTVVVGASGDDEAAHIFTRSGATWTQQAKLTASDAAPFVSFGASVAISGDTVVVGAEGVDGAAQRSGAAYVFTRSGARWSQQAKLTASDAARFDFFGASVAITGDTVVVGAPTYSPHYPTPSSRSGSAYLFARSGASWSQQAKLTASDAAAEDRFGAAVAISGDRLVVGAPRRDEAARDSGAAYLFARSGSTWTQQLKLTASDGSTDDFFGQSVAISGDTVVVGANDDGVALQDLGAAYLFDLIRAGSITGTVTDTSTGAGIGGATVTTEPAARSADADASGAFTFRDVPEGTYTLTASAPGFSTERATVLLAAGQTTTADISLTPLAAISLSATAVDCASVEVGQSSACAVTVTNTGGGTLRGSVRGASPPFAASPSSYSLRAGGSQIVTITFTPTSAGAFTAMLSFSAGGGASLRVSGEGTPPPLVPEAPHSTFDPATGTLHIPALEVLGRGEVYAVDFILVTGSEPPTFELAGARLLDDPPPASSATFDPRTGMITIAAVEVPGLFGSVQIYVVELAIVPFAAQPRLALVDVMLAPEAPPGPRPPSLAALDSPAADPFQLLTISGSGFDPQGEYSVRFFADQGFTVEAPAVDITATSITVGAPPFIDHATGELASGTVNVQVVQTSATPPVTSNVPAGLEIRDLPSSALPPGEITVAFLDASIALFQDTLTRLALLESGSGGAVSSPDLEDLLPKLMADYEEVKREVQSIAAGSSPPVVFAQYNARPVRLDVDALAEIDRLLGAIAVQAASDATAQAALERNAKPQSALPELRAIESVRRLFSLDDPRGEELRQRLRTIGGATSSVTDVNEALAAFGVTSPILQVVKRLGPLGWVGLTLLPSVISLAADINAATASSGSDEFDKVQSALNRFATRTAPSAVTSLLDVVVAGGAPLFSLTAGSAVERLFKDALEDAQPAEEVFRLSQATLDCFEGGQCPRSGLTPPLPEPGAAQGPLIALSPSALSFTATEGGTRPAAQSLTVTNTGGAGSALRFSVTDNAAWLSVTGGLDPLAAGTSRSLAVSVDPTGLSAGTQNGTITVSDANAANSPQTVRVTLTVSAPAGAVLSVAKAGDGGGAVTSSPAGIACGTDCSESYRIGTVVTLTAAADSSSTFTGWSGACSGAGACVVTMDTGKTVTASFARRRLPPLAFTGAALPAATVGQPYTYSFCQPPSASSSDLCSQTILSTNPSGGQPPYHFQLDSGVGFPPFGISLNLNGLLSGTPTAEGTRTFRVCAVDLVGSQTCQTVSLTVNSPLPPLTFIAPPTLPPATLREPYAYSFCQPQPASSTDLCGGPSNPSTNPTGGEPPYSFTFERLGGVSLLPVFLSHNGLLSGTPIEAGTGTFRVCAVDRGGLDRPGSQSCQTVSLTVNSPPQTFAIASVSCRCVARCTERFDKEFEVLVSGTASGPVGAVLAMPGLSGFLGACRGNGSRQG